MTDPRRSRRCAAPGKRLPEQVHRGQRAQHVPDRAEANHQDAVARLNRAGESFHGRAASYNPRKVSATLPGERLTAISARCYKIVSSLRWSACGDRSGTSRDSGVSGLPDGGQGDLRWDGPSLRFLSPAVRDRRRHSDHADRRGHGRTGREHGHPAAIPLIHLN